VKRSEEKRREEKRREEKMGSIFVDIQTGLLGT